MNCPAQVELRVPPRRSGLSASRPKKCPGRKSGNASSVALGWGSLLHQRQPRNPKKSMPPQAPTLWPHQRPSSADTMMQSQRSGWAIPAPLILLNKNLRPQPGPWPTVVCLRARPGPLTILTALSTPPEEVPPMILPRKSAAISNSLLLIHLDTGEAVLGPGPPSNLFPAGLSHRTGRGTSHHARGPTWSSPYIR